MNRNKIALIPGDGIGKEIIPEGTTILRSVASKYGFAFQMGEFPSGAAYCKETGRFMPEDGLRILPGVRCNLPWRRRFSES